VRQSSVLYLMKTIFTIILSIISAVTLSGYPFEPRNFLLLELFVIGIASVLLAIEPNNKRIEGNYLDTVIIRSFPNALAMLAPVIILMIAEKFIPADVLGKTVRNSISMAVIILVAFINLVALCRPFTKWRAAVVSAIGACIAIAIPVSVYFLDDMLGFGLIVHSGANGAADPVILTVFAITMAIGAAFAILMQVFRGKIEKIIAKNIQKKNEREAKLREENGNI